MKNATACCHMVKSELKESNANKLINKMARIQMNRGAQ